MTAPVDTARPMALNARTLKDKRQIVELRTSFTRSELDTIGKNYFIDLTDELLARRLYRKDLQTLDFKIRYHLGFGWRMVRTGARWTLEPCSPVSKAIRYQTVIHHFTQRLGLDLNDANLLNGMKIPKKQRWIELISVLIKDDTMMARGVTADDVRTKGIMVESSYEPCPQPPNDQHVEMLMDVVRQVDINRRKRYTAKTEYMVPPAIYYDSQNHNRDEDRVVYGYTLGYEFKSGEDQHTEIKGQPGTIMN